MERSRALSFSLDSSVGRLARWLRLLGHDAAWERGDSLTAALLRARAEKRILLTRSRDLVRLGLTQPPAGFLCIESGLLDEQLIEVARRYSIFEVAVLFSRCSRCNLPTEELAAHEARRLVPPFVAKTQDRYQRCPSCGQVFWKATHATAMLQRLREAARRSGQRLNVSAADESAGSGNPDPALPEG